MCNPGTDIIPFARFVAIFRLLMPNYTITFVASRYSFPMPIFAEIWVNAMTVCDLLRKVAKEYANLPITLVMDNARYQRCVLVMTLAKELGIELLFLPPYSPNLNLIERYWKFLKKKCLKSKYYENFNLFKAAIITGLDRSNDDWQEDLNALLTLNFQSFDNVKM
jgi:transposase